MKNEMRLTAGVKTGIAVMLFITFFSFFGPLLRPCGEYQIFYIKDGAELAADGDISESGVMIHSGAKPSLAHPLGTDREGRDVLIRLMLGGRVSILLSLLTVIIMCVLGLLSGILCGLDPKGYVDGLIMRAADVVNCIPDIPLILILSSLVLAWGVPEPYRIYGLMGVMGAFGWTSIARLVRNRIRTLKEQEFVLCAKLSGVPAGRRIIRHMLPFVLPQVIALSAVNAGYVVLTESAVSFLGFGVSYPYASWGNMIMTGFSLQEVNRYAHVWIPAGLLIFLLVFSFHLIGEGLCTEAGEDRLM